jgi:predicted dehydrogenase
MSLSTYNAAGLKIGIVGVGKVATDNYLPWLSRREGVQLYYYSRTSANVDAAIGQFGGSGVQSLQELAGNNLDIIFILSNETSHTPIARELLAYGVKRLFIEKPLQATNGQANVTEQDFWDARDMLREAKLAGTEIAMNFNYRFFEQSRNLKKLVQERDLGQLLENSWYVHYACWSHCIDLLRYFGGAVQTITALKGNEMRGEEKFRGQDVAAAFTLRSGAVGTILGSSTSSFRLPLYHATLNFERGTVCLSDLDAKLTLYREGAHFAESYAIMPDKSRWIQYAASFEHSLAAYFEAIEKGEQPPVTGLDGLAELQFEAALKRSAANGRAVDLDTEFPLEGE